MKITGVLQKSKHAYRRGSEAKRMPFLRNKGPFHCVWYAWGNVNYTKQCAFHITLNVHARQCLHWVIVRCCSNRLIHLALLDNEDRTERLPLLLSRTAERLQQQRQQQQQRNVVHLVGLHLNGL